ncbi:19463_t:CDS:10, partial [Funneliformis geosporum]
IKRFGVPVILGDGKELGNWKTPNINLHQPFPQNPTYWQSDPVIISLSSIEKKNDIHYKIAVYIFKPYLRGREERIIFEGNGSQDKRSLDIARNHQFCIWKNNAEVHLHIINDFAFVDYIYNSIKGNNLKDKVMEYQHLLDIHNDLTIRASNLRYHITRQEIYGHYELPYAFPSGLLLDALENYKREILPSDAKDPMYIAVTTLVEHNAFKMQFHWLRIFTIAAEVDPNYTFVDRLQALKYYSNNLLAVFIKGVADIVLNIDGIDFENYVKLPRLLSEVLLHDNNELDKQIFVSFIDQVRENVIHDDAYSLESHFKKLHKRYRDDVYIVFRNHALFLLGSPVRNWINQNVLAIRRLLQNDDLNWRSDDKIQSLELISQSHSLELLNIFPELLDDWLRSDFSDTKMKMLPSICVNWFTLLLTKLGTNDTNTSNEGNFIYAVFERLERMYPLLGKRINVWRNLTEIAIERVKGCSELRIYAATKFIVRIKQDGVKKLFLDMVKEILNKNVQQINDQLLNKIFIICDCKGKSLEIPNSMSEDLLYHIMTRLQGQSTTSSHSEYYLTTLKTTRFWNIILRASGSVSKLNANSFVKNTKISINELGGLLFEKMIDIKLLQRILEYPDDKLFQHFDAAVARKKSLGDVIVSREEIAKLRKLCKDYQQHLDILFKFYSGFCSSIQVINVNYFILDIQQHMQNSHKVKLKQVLTSDYWTFHEKTFESARRCYKYNNSQTFRNIFEICLREDATATNVEYIAQKLMPAVFDRYLTMCKQFKEWEKLKCSDASLFWNVTNVNAELNLMYGYESHKSQIFVQTLDHLSKIPHWIERLEQLEKIVEIFQIPHNEDDWLSKSIRILKNDSMELGQINNFFDYLDRNLSNVNNDCWKLIRELSSADDFMDFLRKIAQHNIKNLCAEDWLDNMVSSFIQVNIVLFPLMDKNKMETISDFLEALLHVIKKDSTLGEKVALCNNIMYISNPGEVTKKELKNAVTNGTYTFTRDQNDNVCIVTLKNPNKTNGIFNINEILGLRGLALVIAKPKTTVNNIINEVVEISEKVINDFVYQVDIAQEIISVVSALIQMGHFGYRMFEINLHGTENMEDCLICLKDELDNWQSMVNSAQEKCYYLTFFHARHILTFYDYYTSEKLDKENEEECRTLVRYVNSNAQLPLRKDVQGISFGSENYPEILCEIGDELQRSFRNIPKQTRKFKFTQHSDMSDIDDKSKLFIAVYTDKTRISNIILSLYANYGSYPESWQFLICNSSTTIEELTIFIKRSFFAANNGYENHLFFRNDKLYLDQYCLEVQEIKVLDTEIMQEIYQELCPNVICVSSDLSGQGKTEWIKEASCLKQKIPYNFLISDDMDLKYLVNKLKECKLKHIQSLHINILSVNHTEDVNLFLFELLTFRTISHNNIVVSIPETFIYIEIASSLKQQLLDRLLILRYLPFKHLSWNIENFRVSQEITSPIQVVCHYLNLYDLGEINTKEILVHTSKASLSTESTISVLYRDELRVPSNFRDFLKSQIIGNPTNLEIDDYNTTSANALGVKLECLARKSTKTLELPEYALSSDNLIKMALILLRVRANIPVIVCGEAGCGKTSLITYLALMTEVKFQTLKFHAGTDEKTINRFMSDALREAQKGEIWILFDEINTCNHLGLLADLISNRVFRGSSLHPNIRLFSTCNPYRLRLTAEVKKYEEKSNLIYQVKPLPDQILDYVWDYGILKSNDEYKYIQIMAEKELSKLAHPVFTELLFASQKFIRKVEEPYSVSLRDIKRAIKLVKFFYNSFEDHSTVRKGYPPPGNPTTIVRSYVLAISLCYHSRLYERDLRKKYRHEMEKILQNHDVYEGENMIVKIIREEQEDYLNRMQCLHNAARNEALLENVFAMIVCILTKIPVLVIGESGSSKSLAIHLITDFAETSPFNPLKILHSLFESNPATEPTVSAIGTSNWRLDISKSSRALLVQSYVPPNFKCILIMDEKNLASVDPSLIGRFEKQYMSINDALNDEQKLLVENLCTWALKISTLIGFNQITSLNDKFAQNDRSIGFYTDDVIKGLVLEVTRSNPKAENEKILEICKERLITLISPDGILRAENSILDRDEIIRLKHRQYHDKNHFIDYELNDNILNYSQRNRKIESDTNFIFDLKKIEKKLVKRLVLGKAHFEMEDEGFFLRNFTFKHESFHNSLRILFDVKNILPQESIPEDKRVSILAMFLPSNSSFILRNSLNLSELHYFLNVILCFIKEISIKNSDILIVDFVNQWLKLARYDITYINIFNEFSLKYIVALYELIEEQVANLVIHNIDNKFKVSLTQPMKDSINDFEQELSEYNLVVLMGKMEKN